MTGDERYAKDVEQLRSDRKLAQEIRDAVAHLNQLCREAKFRNINVSLEEVDNWGGGPITEIRAEITRDILNPPW